METIEEISPKGHQINTVDKIIKWNLTDVEPTKEDDIYVRYYNTAERRNLENYQTETLKNWNPTGK